MSKDLGIRTAIIAGGNTKKMLSNPPVSDVDLVISTVGTMSKLVGTRIYKTDFIRHVIVDEADTMFDETFKDIVTKLLKKIEVTVVII